MYNTIQLGKKVISAEEIIPLLKKYHILPKLLRESILDEVILPYEYTSEEVANACQLATQEQSGMNQADFTELISRRIKVEKFKQATWGNKIDSYFFQRKTKLDKVIYSLLRTKNLGLAQELYFRIQEGEQTFFELAQAYAEGTDAQTGGLCGPVELGQLPEAIAYILKTRQPGQLCQPICMGEWLVIIRLEKLITAQLDTAMRQRLLDELFENWLQTEVSKFN
ncbi:peptidylprolyl isomerase [Nostoc sp.]|uniref:peptidylprolyl isomerase n=1 Tax=Nostoc sp. TaxID=1180 RepID=UPI002FF5E534